MLSSSLVHGVCDSVESGLAFPHRGMPSMCPAFWSASSNIQWGQTSCLRGLVCLGAWVY